MCEREFSEQVFIFSQELLGAFDYFDHNEVVAVKIVSKEKKSLSPDEVAVITGFAAHVGTIIRLTYYKCVFKEGLDVRALADAIVKILMFADVFRFELQQESKKKYFKDIVSKTSHPAWAMIGLLGGDTASIVKHGESFSEYMELVKEAN